MSEQHTKDCTEEHLPSTCGKPCTCQLLRMKELIDMGILPTKAYKIVFGKEFEESEG
jgi:hypothetical protein